MKLYIAGPMTGIPDFNYPQFLRAATTLRAEGFEVECPAENDLPHPQEWHVYLRHAIKRLLDCDAVATLPAAESSKGARLEIYIAQKLGMLVKPVEEWHAEYGE
jgi:hypothetical protein